MRFQGKPPKVAVVTGASRGIGRAIATRLATDGFVCLLVSRNSEALEEAATDIGQITGQRPDWVAVDLRDADAGTSVALALEGRGDLGVLVNCAGATKGGQFSSLTDDDWLDGFALKFHGAVRLTRAVWPALKAAKGTVINIGGDAAFTPRASFMIGGAVNAALEHFSKSLAEMGLRDDVNVNIVHPGMTESDRMLTLLQTQAADAGTSVAAARENAMTDLGIRRLGQPMDVANAVAFLCSPEARHIHGVSLRVDGGSTKSLR